MPQVSRLRRVENVAALLLGIRGGLARWGFPQAETLAAWVMAMRTRGRP
jgi:hypothetical protein